MFDGQILVKTTKKRKRMEERIPSWEDESLHSIKSQIAKWEREEAEYQNRKEKEQTIEKLTGEKTMTEQTKKLLKIMGGALSSEFYHKTKITKQSQLQDTDFSDLSDFLVSVLIEKHDLSNHMTPDDTEYLSFQTGISLTEEYDRLEITD